MYYARAHALRHPHRPGATGPRLPDREALHDPDQYPLTLNALRLACNQSTNRDPGRQLRRGDRARGRAAPLALRARPAGERPLEPRRPSTATWRRRRWGSGASSSRCLSVLLLRGPQTPGELKARSERVVAWHSLEAVEQVLAS